MLKFFYLFAGFSLFFNHPGAWADSSKWCLDPESVQVVWTAFKTTQKIGVNGNFTTLKVSAPEKGSKSLAKLLNSLKAEIKLEGAASLSTENPGRDQTLFDHFFKYLKGPIQIQGKIQSAKGTDEKGELMLQLNLNGKKKPVPMTWTRTPEGAFTAKGSLDVLDFGLKTAFDDLHQTCEALHTGPDGISKTWSEVALQIQAKLSPGCGK